MKPPTGFRSLTADWHNNTYPAISPTNPALSAKGKVVVVTGGGRGIGAETAKAFAQAGAAHVALLGRTQSSLDETKDALGKDFPSAKVTTHAADVADEEAVRKAAAEIGPWDVAILNAGILPKAAPIAETAIGDWWRVFETNVKGAVIMAQAFLPTRRESAAIIGISAGLIQTPTSTPAIQGVSAYNASKIALVKMLEHLSAENPDVFVASVHPGIVPSGMVREGRGHGGSALWDDVKLPAHFLVWLTSPEAKFLKGKFVWANWDVDQLKAKAKEIQGTQLLTSNVLGWPYESRE